MGNTSSTPAANHNGPSRPRYPPRQVPNNHPVKRNDRPKSQAAAKLPVVPAPPAPTISATIRYSLPSKRKSLELPDFASLTMTAVAAPSPSSAIPIPGQPVARAFYPQVTGTPEEDYEDDDEDDDDDEGSDDDDEDEDERGFKRFTVVSTLPPAILPEADKDIQPVAVRITWSGSGKKVVIARAGDDAWKGRTVMVRNSPSSPFTTTISLLPGTHHYRFLVDDQWRVADDLPKAVDDQGSMANYVSVGLGGAVIGAAAVHSSPPPRRSMAREQGNKKDHRRQISAPPSHSFWRNDDDYTLWQGGGWSSDIPLDLLEAAKEEQAYLNAPTIPVITNKYPKTQYVRKPQVPAAPNLPGHLGKVILNEKPPNPTLLAPPTPPSAPPPNSQNKKMDSIVIPDDPSVLPVPSHVVLHHLGTSSVKHGVLAVGSTTRYRDKYNTTIYYKPTEV